MIDTLIRQIKNLPPLPSSVMKIQQVCSGSETDIQALVAIIEHDPMLHANVIKAANSPFYGLSREISDISQAVMLFGTAMIRGFAAAVAIRKTLPVDLEPYGVTMEQLSELSTFQAALVREWCRRIAPNRVMKLQSAAFLMETGKIVCAEEVMMQKTGDAFKSLRDRHQEVEAAEREMFGVSSYNVSAMMFEQWSFETELVEILRHVGSDAAIPEGVRDSVHVLEVVRRAVNTDGMLSQAQMDHALERLQTYRMQEEPFMDAVEALRSRMA